jgi:hypothetical protein
VKFVRFVLVMDRLNVMYVIEPAKFLAKSVVKVEKSLVKPVKVQVLTLKMKKNHVGIVTEPEIKLVHRVMVRQWKLVLNAMQLD